jgi:hypothetical protein
MSDEISILQGRDSSGTPPGVLIYHRGLIPVVVLVRIPGAADRWAPVTVGGLSRGVRRSWS